jgi:acyl-CoA dehydrogenase
MSEAGALLAEAMERIFGDAFDARNDDGAPGFDDELWRQLEELGLPELLVPDTQGGAGGRFEDALEVVRALGRFAIALPLAETLLAARLCADAGIEAPDGPLSIATRSEGSVHRSGAGWCFAGALRGVPWGARSAGIVASLPSDSGPQLTLLRPDDASSIVARNSPAGEPRDQLDFERAAVACVPWRASFPPLLDSAALLRTGQISGALAATLERSLRYAQQREQFGRPITRFQVVQQLLARMGSEVAAVECSTGAAFRAADRGDAAFEIACARLRANQGIELAVATAHQVHGAIGFTHELDLRLFTQRLLCWRSELGNDHYWSIRLGSEVAALGASDFWRELTARADAAEGV